MNSATVINPNFPFTFMRRVGFAASGLSATLVMLVIPPQVLAQGPDPDMVIAVDTNATSSNSLYHPQPIGNGVISTGPNPFPANLPSVEPIFPDAPTEAVRLVLRLSDRRVYVYRGDELEASFPVAVGRAGWETPTGEFEVFSMVEEPGWTNPFTNEVMPPGPDNPLGDRWIAFWSDGNNLIGFHGTPSRDSVGRAASHGCVRLYNEDVRQLYAMVEVGTIVVIEP
ncbi:MAG: L,D-transpeptidase [Cyanobacteria bacterium J06659_2]